MPKLTKKISVPVTRQTIPEPPESESRRLLDHYEERLGIDKHLLDDEIIQHPEMLYKVSEQSALALSYRDEAKNDYEKTVAETDAVIRRDFQERGEKPTEAQIKALATADETVALRWNTYADWKLLSAKWSGMMSSFEARGKALDALTRLYGAGYWADKIGSAPRRDAIDRVAAAVRRRSDLDGIAGEGDG